MDLSDNDGTRPDFPRRPVVKEACAIFNPLLCAGTKRKAKADPAMAADFVLDLVNHTTDEGHKAATGNPNPKRSRSTYDAAEQAIAKLRPPRAGKIPIIEMILRWGPGDSQKEYRVRALLDTGSTVPILDESWAKTLHVPLVQRATPATIQNFAGEDVPGAGEYFSAPLELQHRHHFVLEAFEVAPMCKDFDIVLPAWWIILHVPSAFFTADWEDLQFNSEQC